MTTGYTPKWKTNNGNVIIFTAPNTLFDTYEAALDWNIDQFLFMLPFGLAFDGVFEFVHEDGRFDIPHVKVEVTLLGVGRVIEGPMLDAALAKKENSND